MKSLAVGVLVFNKHNEILLVKPSYKNYWSIPGGAVERNESLKEACLRETKEEIGISLKKCELLVLDYYPRKGTRPENIQFLFYGGVLTRDQVGRIRVDGKEIEAYCFRDLKKSLKLINQRLKKRIIFSISRVKEKANYLEEGRLI